MLKLVQLQHKGRMRATELKNRGMPAECLRHPPFDPAHHTLTIRYMPEGYRSRRVKKAQQLQHLQAAYDNPVGRPYLMVIASNPADAKAKLTAAMLLNRALDVGSTKGKPRWHRVFGTYADPLRDAAIRGDKEVLSLLVISNVTTESTNTKLELVRDLIELYDDTPRILVITGTDPMTFMHHRLKMKITYCLNLSTAHKVEL